MCFNRTLLIVLRQTITLNYLMAIVSVTPDRYSYLDFKSFFTKPVKVRLSRPVQKLINQSHERLKVLLSKGIRIYGVNTGFGNLSKIPISRKDQIQLQLNLVRSHAVGVGKPLDKGLTRLVLFLKLLTFAKGISGVRLEVARQVSRFLNHDILPVIPRKGSVGASGDLAPLAHVALSLIGEGEALFRDRVVPTLLALKEVGIAPLSLQPKEGLSLINGTQVSTALAVKALLSADTLLKTADLAGALSVEATLSSRNAFIAAIHQLKCHPGQQQSARNIWKILEGSEIVLSHKDCNRVQDPYSIRCIPHVHGSSRDVFKAARVMIDNEINSVSDNPLIMDTGVVYSSGHFHAEPVAQALDMLAIAMSEIGAISERRIHLFMKGIDDKIPPFIAHNPGLESGYMVAQVTAAALASENKSLSHPASVDSIPTSAGHEDFVSMAPWAGRKALRIMENVTFILAIEILIAVNSILAYHKRLKPGHGTRMIIDCLKKDVHFTQGDRPLSKDIGIVSEMIKNGKIVNTVQKYLELE